MAIKRKDLTGNALAYVDAVELAEGKTRARRTKYGNRRTYSEIVGRHFASDGERRMAEWLYAMERDGDISDLQYQVSVRLLGCVAMRPDFSYIEDGELIHHEFKGFATDRWRLQKKLWGLVGPGEYRVSKAGQLWPAGEIIRPCPNDDLCLYVLQYLAAHERDDKTLAELIDELEK